MLFSCSRSDNCHTRWLTSTIHHRLMQGKAPCTDGCSKGLGGSALAFVNGGFDVQRFLQQPATCFTIT